MTSGLQRLSRGEASRIEKASDGCVTPIGKLMEARRGEAEIGLGWVSGGACRSSSDRGWQGWHIARRPTWIRSQGREFVEYCSL
ncbi:hypothetical protein SLEP1_g50627 [Rubroshorea leprosula]|uniref:Uncharacterized protein n=1 Tax=Rubroshorea leprosula TaxID=152421 RepID=A0AAV5M319_9ROSI|nr:hypothetical protein SLEP1_g50627 [Rubroshorea leprosula]